MTLRTISVVLVAVTLVLAKEFRDMLSLPGERDLKQDRAKWLAGLVQNKKMFTLYWTKCILNKDIRLQDGSVLKKGTIFRGNGNHSSHLITACLQAHGNGMDEKSIQFVNDFLLTKGRTHLSWSGATPEDLPRVEEGELKALVEYFEAETEEDLVEFWRRSDAQRSVRSSKDQLGTWIGLQPDLKDMEKPKISYALDGVLRAARNYHEAFGFPNAGVLKIYAGSNKGSALFNSTVRSCVKWMVQEVSYAKLYDRVVGAQMMAEVWIEKGEEFATELSDEICKLLDEEDEQVTKWIEEQLHKTMNKPTIDKQITEGRKLFRKIIKEIEKRRKEKKEQEGEQKPEDRKEDKKRPKKPKNNHEESDDAA